MIVVLHVLIALTSLAYSVYVFFSPSKAKLTASYGLIGLTVASGTAVVLSTSGHMLETCMMGLVFLGVSTASVLSARRKLATQIADIQRRR